MDKTVLNTAQQFLHCLEQLSTHKGEVKELEGPMQRCNLIMSSKKINLQECIRIMLNLLEKPAITKKTCNKSLVILQPSAILSEKVQRYQDLNKDPQ